MSLYPVTALTLDLILRPEVSTLAPCGCPRPRLTIQFCSGPNNRDSDESAGEYSRYVSSTACRSTEILRCKSEGDLRVPKVSLGFVYAVSVLPPMSG
jgi:hypothetical protein